MARSGMGPWIVEAGIIKARDFTRQTWISILSTTFIVILFIKTKEKA